MRPAHLLLVPLLAGCAELEPYMPQVRFQRMEVQSISFESVEADFVFSVDNPNPIEIDLSSFSYEFGLQGIDLLSGDDDEGFQLEAVGSSQLVLPVGMGWEDAWDAVQATRGEDWIDFGLAGHFGFETPIGEVPVPYDEDGSFPAVRTPKFSFQTIRVAKLDVVTQTAELEIDIGVDNAHGSSLFFDAFDYDLSLGGRQVASGLIAELGSVEGATEGTLVLPVDVDLVEAGTVVYDALTGGGTLQTELNATMDVDTPFGILPLTVDESGKVSVESR